MSSRPRTPTGAGAPAGAAGAAPDPFLARLEDRLGEGEEATTNVVPDNGKGKPLVGSAAPPPPLPIRATSRPPARPIAPSRPKSVGPAAPPPPAPKPVPDTVPPPPDTAPQSAVHAVPDEGSYAEVPYVSGTPPQEGDPFEAFEDEIEGEAT